MEKTTSFGYRCEGLPDISGLRAAPIVAFDAETDGLHVATTKLIGYSMAYKPNEAFFFMDGDPYAPVEVLTNPYVPKIAHNASFDRGVLKRHGIEINNIIDTMVAAQLAGYESLSLQSLVGSIFWDDILSFKDLGRKMTSLNLQELTDYSGPHSASCIKLWSHLEPILKHYKSLDLFNNVEMPLLNVLSDMELDGVQVDADGLRKLGHTFDEKLASIESEMNKASGKSKLNWRSADQVADYLFNELKLPVQGMTSSGKRPAVDADVLKKIQDRHPVIPILLTHREYSKLKGTYVDGLLKRMVGSRLHTRYNITGTGTGRLSSSDPNFQNIPTRTELGRTIRGVFVASDGTVLLKVDYDQLELKYMAHKSQEPKMLEAFRNGEDIHLLTAMQLFNDPERRFDGKTSNFTVVYGGGPGILAEKTGRSYKECSQWLAEYFKKYNVLAAWLKATKREARDAGYGWTDGGRIRVLQDLMSEVPQVLEHGYRAAISTLIQGSSSELVKRGMIRCYRRLQGTPIRMVLQVHDEIVFECPTDLLPYLCDVVMDTMPTNELSIPITVTLSIGKNWRDMEKFIWAS